MFLRHGCNSMSSPYFSLIYKKKSANLNSLIPSSSPNLVSIFFLNFLSFNPIKTLLKFMTKCSFGISLDPSSLSSLSKIVYLVWLMMFESLKSSQSSEIIFLCSFTANLGRSLDLTLKQNVGWESSSAKSWKNILYALRECFEFNTEGKMHIKTS